MSVTIHEVASVSAATKTAISRKSAQTLPNNPSERGYSAEEIKRRFYQPILDAANSAIAEIDRVVGEVNIAFSDVKDEIDNFIDETSIKEAYKLTLDSDTWEYNDETGLYEVTISQETHGIEDYKEIGVDMFLLDGSGNYTHVNQFEVKTNGDVRCFHETNGAGYVSIYVKREGFIVGTAITDINHVIGAARVARTNSYNDLDNLPDLAGIVENATMISKIISGTQSVGKANAADTARTATYAETAGAADSANTANSSTRATQDQYGVNISNSYAKQNGNYQSMTVGNSTNANKATNDANGVNIANNYAKQNGTYSNMTVGKATNADNATNATNADKATKDANGANISSTYAKQTGTYNSMRVGNANLADRATNADNATKATNDGSGRNIANTYTTGLCLTRETINIQVRVGDNANGNNSVDLYRDTGTYFGVDAYVVRSIDGSKKYIMFATNMRQITVGSNRYDYNYLFLHIQGFSIDNYPRVVRLTSEEYNHGCVPNNADMAGGTVSINGYTFVKYNLFDEGYDFNNGHYILLELMG